MSNKRSIESSEDKKYKQNIDGSSIINEELDLSLSLGLGGNYVVQPLSSKSALNPLNANEDSIDTTLAEEYNDNEAIKPKEQQFSCKYCDKTFPNPQALGGHQNSHRRERILSKMEKEFFRSGVGLSPLPFPYLPMINHPHFGTLPLYHGAQMQPMTDRHPIHWPNYELGNGHRGLHNTSFPPSQFDMSPNSWGISAKNGQRSNHRDEGVGYQHNEVPPFSRDVAQRTDTTHHDYEGLQENYYPRNE